MAVNEDGGTAYSVRLDDVEVSGKTGTAQVHNMGAVRIANRDKEFQLRDHAWFAAYAPTDNPEIVLVIFLEHAGHGGAEAAPVAMNVLREYFDRQDEAVASNFEKLPDGRKVE
jgi:penicillin-binding protein 2